MNAPSSGAADDGGWLGRPALYGASRDVIVNAQLARLRGGLERLLPANAFYRARLDDSGNEGLTDLADMRRLPFTRKADLVSDQREHPPYGTKLTYALREYVRLHQTSGTTGEPLRVLDTAESWDWWAECWAVVLRAAGSPARISSTWPFRSDRSSDSGRPTRGPTAWARW